MTDETTYDAVVVGAGHNGLIAAAYMADAGLRVLVVERRPMAGGACVTEEIAGVRGYRVSTGAAQLGNLRPEIIADLDLAAHGLDLIVPDPLSIFPFPDGRHLAIWTDPGRTRAEFAKFSARDAEALPAYMADCMTVCDVIEPLIYGDTIAGLADIEAGFVAIGRSDLYEPFIHGSMADVLDARFESDEAKTVLGYTATFGTNGGPRTPGTAYVMVHHLFGGTTGVRGRAVYVRGGMGGLADALAGAAKAHGVEIRTGVSVAGILTNSRTIDGVELDTGETLRARAVISNADPHHTFLALTEATALPDGFAGAVADIQMQGVAIKVNCALTRLPTFTAVPDGVVPARVSLCPSLDYVEAAWMEASRGHLSSAPFMTIHMQSAVDDSLVDGSGHTLTCYTQFFPYNLAPELGGWERQRAEAGRIVLDTVAAYAPDLHDCVIATEVMSPVELEQRFGMTGGHQFHGDLMPPTLFDQRPAPGCAGARTPLDGLYLCGAGAHPGGCIWGAPGQRAAAAVIADLSG